MHKYKFIVSRKFQVQRYISYINYYGISSEDVQFFDVSEWTGGDCGTDFPDKFFKKTIKRPQILKDTSFGNRFHYFVCLILIFNAIRSMLFKRKIESRVIFIDQYFSPFEVLAMVLCLSKNNLIVVHQHAQNCHNQLVRNFSKNLFDLITHKLMKNIFNQKKYELRYIAFATSETGKELFSKSFKDVKVYLVGNITLSSLADLKSNSMQGVSTESVAIISPGMYRYKSNVLATAQNDFFKVAEDVAKYLFKDVNVTYRLKAGEPTNFFSKVQVSELNQDFYKFLDSFDVIITTSISSTWLEGVLLSKGVVIVKNTVLEREYPILSELFLEVLKTFSHNIITLQDLDAFYIPRDDMEDLRLFLLKRITPFCDPFNLIGKLQWQKL